MKQEIKTDLYASPEVGVIEAQAQQVICLSGGTNDMDRDPDQSLDWYW